MLPVPLSRRCRILRSEEQASNASYMLHAGFWLSTWLTDAAPAISTLEPRHDRGIRWSQIVRRRHANIKIDSCYQKAARQRRVSNHLLQAQPWLEHRHDQILAGQSKSNARLQNVPAAHLEMAGNDKARTLCRWLILWLATWLAVRSGMRADANSRNQPKETLR